MFAIRRTLGTKDTINEKRPCKALFGPLTKNSWVQYLNKNHLSYNQVTLSISRNKDLVLNSFTMHSN